MHRIVGIATAASLLFVAAPPVTLAQDLLEEIVVTARKREESLQDVPVSISVLTSDTLLEAGIRDAYDLFEMTPGISWEQAQDRQGSRPSSARCPDRRPESRAPEGHLFSGWHAAAGSAGRTPVRWSRSSGGHAWPAEFRIRPSYIRRRD